MMRFVLVLAGVCMSAVSGGPVFAADASLSLTDDERRFISEHPVIRVAPAPSHEPIEALDARRRLTGVSADYLAALEQKTGLRFDVLKPRNWDESLRMVRTRDADLLTAATPTESRKEYLSFTKPHITLPGVIVVRKDGTSYADLDALRGRTVGVVSGYVWQELIARDYPDVRLKPVSNMEAGLLLTSFGELDAMIGNLATATHTVQRLGIANLRVSNETGYSAMLAFASRNDWPHLNAVLQKGLSAIPPEEHLAILNRHIAFTEETGPARNVLLLMIVATIGVLLMAGAVAWIWNKSLRQMVEQRNKELRESSERYRAIVQDQTDLISRSLPGSHILTFVNDAYCAHLNLSREELLGRNMLEFAPKEERAGIETRIASLTPENLFVREENRLVSPDGEIRWFYWSNRAIFDQNGRLTEIQSVGRDITDRKRSEEALRAAKEEAELASRVKSEFLANFSHELRTPLNAIIGFSEMISGELLGRLNERRYRDYADNILSSGNHLLGLINDILDVAKIETGQADFEESEVDLPEVIDIALLMTRERAKAREVEIHRQMPAETSLTLVGDRRRLIQIMVNLLSNAIKFTDAGGMVTIDVDREPGGHMIRIADTGIGIAADDIPKIFERFGQVDSNIARKEEGTGIGLSLTKDLVELHGGAIDVESELGVGTTVSVWLPAEQMAQSA